jgi:hypothetical protein
MMVEPTDPWTFIRLAKMAKERGKLTGPLYCVYALNYIYAKRRIEAATAMAARDKLFEN